MRRTALLLPLLAALPAGCENIQPVPPAPPPPGFSAADLAGDWSGLLTSANPLLEPVNLVLRFDATGALLEARDGRGNTWLAGTDTLTVTLDPDGAFTASLALADGTRVLDLSGVLSPAAVLLKGTFVLSDPATGVLDSGTFELDLSPGPGAFSVVSHLMGAWSGTASTPLGTVFTLKLTIGPDGSVLGGLLDDVAFTVGGPNTGIFAFADDSLGLLVPDIVIEAVDATTLTLHQGLVNLAGTTMSTTATHSAFGAMEVRLTQR